MRKLGVSLAALAAVIVAGSVGSAQQADAEAERGSLIQIGPDRAAEGEPAGGRGLLQPGFREAPQAVSRYWIGVAGGPVPPEVRAHVRMDDDAGVILRSVQEGSPAEEGGLKQFDIVTRVDGDALVDMRQFANAVGEAGQRKVRMTVEILREGQPKTVWVTPEERPIDPTPPRRPWPQGGGFGFDAAPGFGMGRGLGGFANGRGLGQLPNGLSIGIQQSGDGPAKLTVRRGEESWELNADDPDAIAALPDDIRPFVERAVNGAGGFGGLLGGGRDGGGFGFGPEDPLPGFAPGDLQQRLLEMEEQVQELRRRFGAPAAPPAANPQAPPVAGAPAES